MKIKLLKSKLRKKGIKLRNMISPSQHKTKSMIIVNKILSLEIFRKAKNVMLYYPFRNEVNVLPIISKSKNIIFWFPKIDWAKKCLVAVKYNKKFKKNKYGILEPTSRQKLNIEKLDLVIVPGVIFDKRCYRIGYGGGYYDRFLKQQKVFKIGVCFENQVMPKIPHTKNDVQLDMVVTEKNIYTKISS